MRVVQVVDTLEIGGLESIAVGLANGLAERGHHSALLTTRRDGPLLTQVDPAVQKFCARRTTSLDPLGMARTAKWIRHFQPDVVHAHDLGSASLMWTVLRGTRHPATLVMHDHNGPRIGRPLSQRERWIFPRLDAYLAVAEGLAQRASQAGLATERIAVLRNGVTLPAYQALPVGPLTVIQVANLREPKNQEMAVRTAALVAQSIPDLRWILVGRAPENDTYAQKIRSTVDRLGMGGTVVLAGAKELVSPEIQAAHLGVLTSRDEGLPLSILEVLAHGRPAIMTDVGDGPEVIRDADAGSVVPVDDDNAMAHAIQRWWEDREGMRLAGLRGREHIVAHYSTQAMVSDVLRCYLKARNPETHG